MLFYGISSFGKRINAVALGFPRIGTIIDVARKVDRLFENVEKTQKGLEKLDERLRALEDRMTKLEANAGNLIVEAKSAARDAAGTAIIVNLTDMARRIGGLETSQMQLMRHVDDGNKTQKRLE